MRDLNTDKQYRSNAQYLPATTTTATEQYDIDDVDTVIRLMIKSYENLSSQNDVKSVLTLKNIRLRHPLFSKLSLRSFQFLMEHSYIYKLKPGQFIYREGIAAA